MINNYIKNAKLIMSNKLKFIKLLFFVFVLCLINISYSNAACDFDGLRIGDKSSDAEGTFGEANTENNNTVEVKTQKLGRKARFKALLLDKNFEQENPKKLEELTDETCRWPIGHPYEKKFYFCGRKPMQKFPYCKLHVLYAFQPKNAKEEDIITEEDVPVYEKKIKSA